MNVIVFIYLFSLSGGILVFILLFFIALICICVFCCKQKRNNRHKQSAKNQERKYDHKYNQVKEDLKKISNVEKANNAKPVARSSSHAGMTSHHRPTNMMRPVSYAQSTDSYNTLNNLDCVNNYGSAGDELEALPIEIPEFLKNKYPPPPPPPDLHKNTWENHGKNYNASK